MKTTIRTRVGLAEDIPQLQLAELGFSSDKKTLHVGDETSSPPALLTTKTVGDFDLSSVHVIFSNQTRLQFQTEGAHGWTPSFETEERDDGRQLIKISGYSGGEGSPPGDTGYYLRHGGPPTPNHNLATNFRGATGLTGQPAIIYFEMNDDGELIINIANYEENAPVEAEINAEGELILSYILMGNMMTVNLGRIISIYRGTYNNGVQYVSLDEVRYQGALYRAKYGVTILIGTEPSDASKWSMISPAPIKAISLDVGDETTALTLGDSKLTTFVPYAFTVTGVKGYLNTAQASGSILTIDLKRWNGSSWVSILSTLITFDNTENTLATAATPAVFSTANLVEDDRLRVDITQIGNGTAAGLKLALVGYQP